jgi:NAD(P)-dependent dehydrogenase (short-subunit alcohol dehydrogenase family)
MSQKKVFVTGAGRGIGQAIALKLASENFIVCGSARTLSELETTQKLSHGKIRIQTADVTDKKSINTWLEKEFNESTGVPYGLINAAGVQGPVGVFTENSFDEWKACIEINLFGSALVTQLFSQKLIAKKLPGSIVLLSGGGATASRPYFSSYGASKTAVVRLVETLSDELREHQIIVNSIAPGAINTKLTEDVLKAGPEKIGKKNYDEVLKQKASGGNDIRKPAELSAYLMSEEARVITGKLISAVWDPWPTLHEKAKALQSDIFTLRRIVPEDRPKVWNL